MSREHFRIIDKKAIDSSNIKRDFLKIYHQRAATSNDSDQNIESIFAEKINSYQTGKAFFNMN